MVIGNNYTIGEVYLEPGKTLSLYIDFEDLLARSRARDAFYPLRHIMYGGSLGEVNRQLAEAPVFPLDYEDLKAMSGKLAPMQVRGECDRAVAAWSKALEKYMDEKQVSPKARRILEIQEKVSGALWLHRLCDDLRKVSWHRIRQMPLRRIRCPCNILAFCAVSRWMMKRYCRSKAVLRL